MRPYRFTRAPAPLRKAKLDNVALLPASLLPFKAHWQRYANTLAEGSVLICLPRGNPQQRDLLEHVAGLLAAKGCQVTTCSPDHFA